MEYAKKVVEQRVAEAIKFDHDFLAGNPHLIALLSTFLDKEDFELDTKLDLVKPAENEAFLKTVYDDLATVDDKVESEQCQERFGQVKNMILEKMKNDGRYRNGRRNSISGSQTSEKRKHDDSSSERRQSRPRTSIPRKKGSVTPQ